MEEKTERRMTLRRLKIKWKTEKLARVANHVLVMGELTTIKGNTQNSKS